MGRELKSIQKSVRMTPKVYNYIDSYAGDGFNDKLQSLVLESLEGDAERKARLEMLDRMVSDRYARLNKLDRQVQELELAIRDVCQISDAIRCLKRRFADICPAAEEKRG